jgi:CubicO group peptidase (beta-lactamase class C family)
VLANRGVIDLDSPLSEHLDEGQLGPDLQPERVLLRDLMRHTSGLENGPITFRLAYSGEHTPESLWRLIGVTQANQAGLGHFQYTNYGYNLLTILLEHEFGTKWQDLLQQEIFDPLGMTHTSAYASVPRAKGHVLAAPYDALHPDGPRRLPLEKDDSQMQSAGGMMLSPRDAARWMLFQIHAGELDGDRIVDAAIVRDTQRPWTSIEGADASDERATACGAAWMIGDYQGRPRLHHGGGYPGFRSWISFMPEEQIGVAVFVNEASLGGNVMEVVAEWCYDWWFEQDVLHAFDRVDEIAERADQALLERSQTLEQHAERNWTLGQDRKAYAGSFENEDMGVLEISVSGDSLHLRAGRLQCEAGPYPNPESMRVELIPGQGMVINFEFDPTGKVSALRLRDDLYVKLEPEN